MRYKKIISGLCAAIIFSATFSIAPTAVNAAKSEIAIFNYDSTSSLKACNLKWEKQKGAAYYKVYRAKYKISKNDNSPKKSKYKKIATVKSAKYVDKKAKLGVYYYYYINSFSKDNKLLGTTFEEGVSHRQVAGLAAPDVENGGYGEGRYNSTKTLYAFVRSGGGVDPSGYILYRKAAGDKKYKKITEVKTDFYADNNVKAGQTYYYKAKAFYKKGNKTYYSKASKKLMMQAVDYDGKYTAKYLSTQDNEITFSLTSKKYNGKTIIHPCTGTMYITGVGEDGIPMKLTQYSFDNKTWKNIPKKGIAFKAGQTIYVKGTSEIPSGFTAEKAIIGFEDNDIYYNNIGGCYTQFSINFEMKRATADNDWD